MNKYILAIDQSTTATKAVLFNNNGEFISQNNLEHKQYFPNPGWVEHDAEEIYQNTKKVVLNVLKNCNVLKEEMAAVGITNQRETTVIWDRKTGKQ
ncbi:MAG: glycerol kinase, partial [Mariniphaga sp.]|nr:glycerol kinase [Mariniphaga sp.]